MSAGVQLIHSAALAAVAGAILYSATVTVCALVATLAQSRKRRRAAQLVLMLLIHRHR